MISNRESADVNNENLEEYFKQYIINMVGRKLVTAGKYFWRFENNIQNPKG